MGHYKTGLLGQRAMSESYRNRRANPEQKTHETLLFTDS